MKTEKEGQIEKLFKKLSRKVGKTIRDQALIVEGDRVLVGLSGGKDSMVMLQCIADRKKSFPFPFKLYVAHIIPESTGYSVNINLLEDFCNNLGLELIVRKIKIEPDERGKSICFVCSWHRRKALFDLTRELDCNKLAFGHHRDDALQTFLMNMLYHGSISSLPYSLKLFEGRVHMIRPMLDLWEKDIQQLSDLENFGAVEKTCTHEDLTKRFYTSELLKKIESEYPNAKINMFHALDNIYGEYLPTVKKKSNKDTR
ncbi:MAG: tRNA lysidine(34) synthetase [Bacteroidales bacterium]